MSSYSHPDITSNAYRDGERDFLLQRINRDRYNPEGEEDQGNYAAGYDDAEHIAEEQERERQRQHIIEMQMEEEVYDQ